MSTHTVDLILSEAQSFLQNFKSLKGHEHQDGFRLCIMDPRGTKFEYLIGQMTEGNDEFFRKSALRKALHLNARPAHISSSQSRHPEALMYSGAVRTADGWIIAVAGLTEVWDEVAAATIAYMTSSVEFDETHWDKVRQATSNPHMIAMPLST